MLRNVEQQQEVVVDARGAARFQAKAPEPRPGMRGGHIPHSRNVPFDAVLSDGRYSQHVLSLIDTDFMSCWESLSLKLNVVKPDRHLTCMWLDCA